MVEVELSAEARAASNRTECRAVVTRRRLRTNKPAVDALVTAFGVIVCDELAEQVTQMSLPEDHEMVETPVRTVLTTLSACELQFGLFAGNELLP